VTPEDSYVGGYVPRSRKESLCPEGSAATDVSGSGDVLGDIYVAPEDLATDRGWSKRPRFGKQVAVMPAHTLPGVGPAAASPSFAAIGLVAPDSGAASAFGQTREKPEQFPVQPPSSDAYPLPGPAFPRQPVAPPSAVLPRQLAGAAAPRDELRPPRGGPVPRKPAGRSAGAARTVAPQASPPASTSPPPRRGRSSPEFQAAVAASRALDRSLEARNALESANARYRTTRDDPYSFTARVVEQSYLAALEAAAGAGPVRENLQGYVQAVRQVSQNTKYWERDQRLVVQEAARQKTQALRAQLREQKGLERRYGRDKSRQDAGATARSARQGARGARDVATGTRGWLTQNRDKVSPQTANELKKKAADVQADRKALEAAARQLDSTARNGSAEDLKLAQKNYDGARRRLFGTGPKDEPPKVTGSLNELAELQDEAAAEARGGPRGEAPPGVRGPSEGGKAPPDSGAGQEGAPEDKEAGAAPPAPAATTPTGTFPNCGPCTASCEGQCHPPCKEGEVCQCAWVEGTVPTIASAAPPPSPPAPPPADGPATVAPLYSGPGSTPGSGPDSRLGKIALTPPVAPVDSGLMFQQATQAESPPGAEHPNSHSISREEERFVEQFVGVSGEFLLQMDEPLFRLLQVIAVLCELLAEHLRWWHQQRGPAARARLEEAIAAIATSLANAVEALAESLTAWARTFGEPGRGSAVASPPNLMLRYFHRRLLKQLDHARSAEEVLVLGRAAAKAAFVISSRTFWYGSTLHELAQVPVLDRLMESTRTELRIARDAGRARRDFWNGIPGPEEGPGRQKGSVRAVPASGSRQDSRGEPTVSGTGTSDRLWISKEDVRPVASDLPLESDFVVDTLVGAAASAVAELVWRGFAAIPGTADAILQGDISRIRDASDAAAELHERLSESHPFLAALLDNAVALPVVVGSTRLAGSTARGLSGRFRSPLDLNSALRKHAQLRTSRVEGVDVAAATPGLGEQFRRFLNVYPDAADPSRRAQLVARYMAQGKSEAEARALSAPLGRKAMGEHWISRSRIDDLFVSLTELGHYRAAEFVRRFRDSRFNVLKPRGISRGEFERLHYLVDPARFGGSFGPQSVFRFSGAREGLLKYGSLRRVWFGTPTRTKIVIGAGAVGAGVGAYEVLVPGD
jgi:hypothetical protein